MSGAPKVVLLAGGFGGARLAPALARALGPDRLTVVANVGDDLEWFGLRVCPDLDSITYALAGLWDRERGWGRRGETFRVRDALRALGTEAWFAVGDGDLATHLERTRRLREGASLTEVTRALAAALGVRGVEALPASDRPSPTRVRLRDGTIVDFQDWYVRRRARADVAGVLIGEARAAPAVLGAVKAADAIVLGPSNPVSSIGPILALRGMRDAVGRTRRRIAVSPVAARRPIGIPSLEHHAAARRSLLAAEGSEDRPGAIARRYRGIVEAFVLDPSDADEAEEVRRAGLEPVLADILDDDELAATVASLAAGGRRRAGNTGITPRRRAPTSPPRRARGTRRRSR